MSRIELVTGDDVILLHQLTKYDKTLKKQVEFNIPNTATVKSRLVSPDGDVVYTDSITQTDTTGGADWSTSLVAASFDSATTSEILNKDIVWDKGRADAKIETQVDDGGKLTWFASVILVKGTIL